MLIDAETGWPITLRNLVERRDRTVLTLREAGVIRPQRPSGFLDQQEAQLFRLTTLCGRSIEATAKQLFLTRDGWKPLAQLDPSDAVAVVVEYPQVFGRGDTDAEFVKLVAYLTANGTTGDGMVPAFDDGVVHQDFEAAVVAKGDECAKLVDDDGVAYRRVHGKHGARSRVLAYLDLVGVHGVCAADKFVPDFVFGLTREKLRLYLNRLFTCDGAAEASRIVYHASSVRMAREVQHLLARFGINCVLRGRERDGVLDSILLTISSKVDALRYLDEIGFLGAKAIKAESTRTLLNHVRMVDPPLDRLGPILFDDVFAVEVTERAPVYDLTIDGFRNFIANDFVVHNASRSTGPRRSAPRGPLRPARSPPAGIRHSDSSQPSSTPPLLARSSARARQPPTSARSSKHDLGPMAASRRDGQAARAERRLVAQAGKRQRSRGRRLPRRSIPS
jgi:hypothetical protein